MKDGELDLTWKLTARRVKEEFQNAGIFGVDDKKIELVVARCRKSYLYLLKHRMVMPIDKWERFSFSGCLALILVNAGEARKSKHGLSPDNIRGAIKPSAI
jgi:hypothetical protein